MFELERGRANREIHRLQGTLETALGKKLVLPERKLESIEPLVEQFPEVKTVIFDGTERPCNALKTPNSKRSITLANAESDAATQELLAIPGLLEQVKRNQATPPTQYLGWRTLRSDV